MSNVTSVMRECRNFFETGYREKRFSISGGKLEDNFLANGQYIAISGSLFNDGVHVHGVDQLADEVFYGRVWYLRPPHDFILLCEEIAQYNEKTPMDGFTSESFAGYSYTRSAGENGGVLTWQQAFRNRLVPFRRMFTEVEV